MERDELRLPLLGRRDDPNDPDNGRNPVHSTPDIEQGLPGSPGGGGDSATASDDGPESPGCSCFATAGAAMRSITRRQLLCYSRDLLSLLLFYWSIAADGLLISEFFKNGHLLFATAAIVSVSGHHLLMSLLLIVRQGWVSAAGQSCGFLLSLNPLEAIGPVPEGVLGLLVLAIAYVVYILIAASGFLFVLYCIVCYVVSALLFSLLVLDLAAAVITVTPAKNVFRFCDLIYMENFKASRLVLQAALESLPQLFILLTLGYQAAVWRLTGGQQRGQAVAWINTAIYIQAVLAHALNLVDKAAVFRADWRGSGALLLRQLANLFLVKAASRVPEPVLRDHLESASTQAMRGAAGGIVQATAAATLDFSSEYETGGQLDPDGGVVPDYLTPLHNNRLAPGQVLYVMRGIIAATAAAQPKGSGGGSGGGGGSDGFSGFSALSLDLSRDVMIGRLIQETQAAFAGLRSIRLDGVRIDGRDGERLAVALINCHQLSTLELHTASILKGGAASLARFLAASPQLLTLDLTQCTAPPAAWTRIAEGICSSPSLQHLRLAGSNVTNDACVRLARALIAGSSKLDAGSSIKLDAGGCSKSVAGGSGCSGLVLLDLSFLRLNDAVCSELADALQHSTTLRELVVSHADIRTACTRQLVEAARDAALAANLPLQPLPPLPATATAGQDALRAGSAHAAGSTSPACTQPTVNPVAGATAGGPPVPATTVMECGENVLPAAVGGPPLQPGQRRRVTPGPGCYLSCHHVYGTLCVDGLPVDIRIVRDHTSLDDIDTCTHPAAEPGASPAHPSQPLQPSQPPQPPHPPPHVRPSPLLTLVTRESELMSTLAMSLLFLPDLCAMDLTGLGIGDAGAAQLAEVLGSLASNEASGAFGLHSLNLSFNNMSDEGLLALIAVLSGSSFAADPAAGSGSSSSGRVAATGTAQPGKKDEAAAAAASGPAAAGRVASSSGSSEPLAVARRLELWRLNLSMNAFSDEGALQLADALLRAPRHIEITMVDNRYPFSLDVLRHLLQTMEENPKVSIVLIDEQQSDNAERAGNPLQPHTGGRQATSGATASGVRIATASGVGVNHETEQPPSLSLGLQHDRVYAVAGSAYPNEPSSSHRDDGSSSAFERHAFAGNASAAASAAAAPRHVSIDIPDVCAADSSHELCAGDSWGSTPDGVSVSSQGQQRPSAAVTGDARAGSSTAAGPPSALHAALADKVQVLGGAFASSLSRLARDTRARAGGGALVVTSAPAATSPILEAVAASHASGSSSSSSSPKGGASAASSVAVSLPASEDVCGVCFDLANDVSIKRCGHKLCVQCFREIQRQLPGQALCPFCRACIEGYVYLHWPRLGGAAPAGTRSGGHTWA